MKLVIGGVTFDNPTHLRIEVDPAGEVVAPWRIEIVGGPLTVRSIAPEPALEIDHTGLESFEYADKVADLVIETRPLSFIAYGPMGEVGGVTGRTPEDGPFVGMVVGGNDPAPPEPANAIEDQIGPTLARETGGEFEFVCIWRCPGDPLDDGADHARHCSVGEFLSRPENQKGTWLIDGGWGGPPGPIHVRWNEAAGKWENGGYCGWRFAAREAALERVFLSYVVARDAGEERDAPVVMHELAAREGFRIVEQIPQPVFDGWEFLIEYAGKRPELPAYIGHLNGSI